LYDNRAINGLHGLVWDLVPRALFCGLYTFGHPLRHITKTCNLDGLLLISGNSGWAFHAILHSVHHAFLRQAFVWLFKMRRFSHSFIDC
jgi:hypothetical protein